MKEYLECPCCDNYGVPVVDEKTIIKQKQTMGIK